MSEHPMNMASSSGRFGPTSTQPTLDQTPRDSEPGHVNSIAWHQSIGLARQACARIFRDGGSPADALTAFGIDPRPDVDWSRAVERIAESLAAPALRRAA